MRVLATERLVLRWLEPADASFVLELLNDPDWPRYIGDRGRLERIVQSPPDAQEICMYATTRTRPLAEARR